MKLVTYLEGVVVEHWSCHVNKKFDVLGLIVWVHEFGLSYEYWAFFKFRKLKQWHPGDFFDNTGV